MVSDSKDVYEFTRFESVRFLTALLLLGGAAYTFATGPLICALFLSISSAVLLCNSCKLHFEAPRWGALDTLLLLILGGAIFFRAYALTEYPEGFSGHTTAQFQIRKVAIHELLPALPQGDWRTVRAALTHIIDEETGPVGIIEAIGFAFYGASADTTRIMPAVVGTLSVLLAYFLGLALHNRSTARIFALLLATCPWNIAFSRYDNLEHVMAPCHLLACLLALQTAAESGRKLLYLVAGILIGLSFYVYAPNQVIPGLTLLYMCTLILREKAYLRKNGLNLICIGLGFASSSYLQLSRWTETGRYIPIRKSPQLVEMGFSDWLGRAYEIYEQLFFHVRDPWFGKFAGALGEFEMTLCLAGILLFARQLTKRRDHRKVDLVFLWLIATIVPPLCAPDAPFRRIALFATALLFCSAAALTCILESARQLPAPISGLLRSALVTGLIAYSLYCGHYYFRHVVVHETCSSVPLWQVAREMRSHLGKELAVAFVPQRMAHDLVDKLDAMAYQDFQELHRSGKTNEDLFAVLTPDSCQAFVKENILPKLKRPYRAVMFESDLPLFEKCLRPLAKQKPQDFVFLSAPRCRNNLRLPFWFCLMTGDRNE